MIVLTRRPDTIVWVSKLPFKAWLLGSSGAARSGTSSNRPDIQSGPELQQEPCHRPIGCTWPRRRRACHVRSEDVFLFPVEGIEAWPEKPRSAQGCRWSSSQRPRAVISLGSPDLDCTETDHRYCG